MRRFVRVLAPLLILAAACGGPVGRTADRGIGGTGIAVTDKGIGGTGIAVTDKGIGGTGIVGTVTAFGSIWVNGLEVEVPAGAAVRLEGRPADAGALLLGQTVAVAAAPGGPTGLEARTVEVRYAVAGPVEAVAEGRMTVLGQRVELDGALAAAEPKPGAWVAVSGLRRPDGSIAAGRIDPWDAARGWLLRGPLEAADAATVTVAGRALRRAGTGAALPETGATVRAAGRMERGAPVLDTLAADPLNPFGTAVRALSVEAFVNGARVVMDGGVDSGGGLQGARSRPAPGIGEARGPQGGPPGGPPGVGPAAGPEGAPPGPGAAPGRPGHAVGAGTGLGAGRGPGGGPGGPGGGPGGGRGGGGGGRGGR